MPKPKVNYIIDVIMVLLFLGVAKSGIVLYFFLPAGQRRGGWQTFFGLTKHTWSAIHNWCGLLLIALILVHIILHWKWILEMTKNIFKGK